MSYSQVSKPPLPNNFLNMTIKPKISASKQFSAVLSQVISKNQVNVVLANETTIKSKFRKNKTAFEEVKDTDTAETETESLTKSIKRIEQKIITIAELERQNKLGKIEQK
jgi:hypothetical protein